MRSGPRWRWWLLSAAVVLLLALLSAFIPIPLRDFDKADAARRLVAWIVEGESVPGFGKPYPDARWMPEMKRFFVVCDFLPPEVSLSDDPRVQRITTAEYEGVFEKHRFDDTDYVVIELKSETGSVLVVQFSNAFAPLAGHGYQFEFRRTLRGLRASGKRLWVS